jgi:hypothetical protein
MRRVLLFLLPFAVVLGVAMLVRNGTIVVPPRWNPWAPLDVADEPGLFTRFKLSRLERDPAVCLEALSRTSFRFRALADRETGNDCGFHNAVSIVSSDVSLGGPLTLSCPATVALALWERHELQPAALRWFGRRVKRIEHLGSYACRNVYGREDAPRSEHATANAIDVAGFVFDDGRRVRVLEDWNAGTDAARFLRDADAGACRFFDAVLDPDYNAAHRDHLHLDRGRYHFCR